MPEPEQRTIEERLIHIEDRLEYLSRPTVFDADFWEKVTERAVTAHLNHANAKTDRLLVQAQHTEETQIKWYRAFLWHGAQKIVLTALLLATVLWLSLSGKLESSVVNVITIIATLLLSSSLYTIGGSSQSVDNKANRNNNTNK